MIDPGKCFATSHRGKAISCKPVPNNKTTDPAKVSLRAFPLALVKKQKLEALAQLEGRLSYMRPTSWCPIVRVRAQPTYHKLRGCLHWGISASRDLVGPNPGSQESFWNCLSLILPARTSGCYTVCNDHYVW